jgi:hypothetical protein
MKTIERAKLALREHLLKNKEQAIKDLAEMRFKSEGKDIFHYVENVAKSFSLDSVTVTKEVTYDVIFLENDSLQNDTFIIECEDHPFFEGNNNYLKKDLEKSRGLFFLV